jgi:Protein of unknown function (DUF3341)
VLLGIFREPESVAAAMRELRTADFGSRELTVVSSVPYPEGTFAEAPESHRLYVFTFAGAACGLAVGLLVTIGTQLSYPMVTGGKPLLAIPPMLIVLFEATLLGAIIFTVAGVIFESRLPDASDMPSDQRISEGYLGLAVRADGRQAEAERLLREHGAVDVIVSSPSAEAQR